MESNSCIQNRSEPFWFGQVWRKVYLPSCRATILRQDSTGPDLLLLWYSSWRTLALCSAPVKPQCSNLLDLSPSEASIINMCFQGHPFLMIHGGGGGHGEAQTSALGSQQHSSQWWQWWKTPKTTGKYWCFGKYVLIPPHKYYIIIYHFLLILLSLLFPFTFPLALPSRCNFSFY